MSDIPGTSREQEIDITGRTEEAILVKENAKLQRENAELRNENTFLKARLDGMVASASWRLTVPLRFAQRLARGEWRAARKSLGIGLRIGYHGLRVGYHKVLPRPLREKVAFGRAGILRYI